MFCLYSVDHITHSNTPQERTTFPRPLSYSPTIPRFLGGCGHPVPAVQNYKMILPRSSADTDTTLHIILRHYLRKVLIHKSYEGMAKCHAKNVRIHRLDTVATNY